MVYFDIEDLSRQARAIETSYLMLHSTQQLVLEGLYLATNTNTDNVREQLWETHLLLNQAISLIGESEYGLNRNALSDEKLANHQVKIESMLNNKLEISNFDSHSTLVEINEMLNKVVFMLKNVANVFTDFNNNALTVEEVGEAFNFLKYSIRHVDYATNHYLKFYMYEEKQLTETK